MLTARIKLALFSIASIAAAAFMAKGEPWGP